MNGSREEIIPPSERKALEWITALAAAGLPYQLVNEGAGSRLLVPAGQRNRAWDVITAYEMANVGWPPKPRGPVEATPLAHPVLSGLWGSGFLVMVFVCFGPYDPTNAWLRAGASDSAAIAAGQWWRPITALTLHSGFGHLAGNALFLTILGGAACRSFGVGLAWTLILLSGVLGNALTAWAAAGDHVAVGASTASFGALGILAVDQAARNFRRTGEWKSIWSRIWVPLCGGFAMLAFLGMDPGTDIVGHGFGFLSGLILAVPFCIGPRRGLSEGWQAALKIGSALLILLAWRAAIRFAG